MAVEKEKAARESSETDLEIEGDSGPLVGGVVGRLLPPKLASSAFPDRPGSGPVGRPAEGKWQQPGAQLYATSSSRLAWGRQLQLLACARGLPGEQSAHISLLEAK